MNDIQYKTVCGNLVSFDVAFYPDGAPLVKHLGPEPIDTILLRPSSFAAFMGALFWVDSLEFRGCDRPDLILPLVPGSRQDRLNTSGDQLFTAKSVADAINARAFPSVTILDPHSDVTPALIDRCRVVSAADCIKPPAGKYAAVVSPDAGAEKRASAVAQKLGVPLLHGWKKRDVSTGAISGFGLEPSPVPTGSLVLVVDDLCDGGGTFIGLADKLDEAGLKAHLWTTHGLYTRGTAELLRRFGHIYCTDSATGPREGVIEVKVCERLLAGDAP